MKTSRTVVASVAGFINRLGSRPRFLLTGATVTASALGLASGAFQAHLLGPADRGQLAIAMTPGVLLSVLLCFGVPEYLTRATARGLHTRVLSSIALVAAVATGILCLAPYLLFASVAARSDWTIWLLLVAFAATVPLFVYGYCLIAITAGSGLWRSVAALRALAPLVSVVGLGLLLVFGKHGQSVLMVGLFLLSVSAVAPLLLLTNRQVRPVRLPMRDLRAGLAVAYRFGFRSWSAGSIAFLNQRVDLLLVTMLAAPSEVGFYAVSVSLAAVVTAGVNAFIAPMRNRVARDGLKGVEVECANILWFSVALVGLIVLALPWLIQLVLGSSFLPARGVMSVVMLGQIPLVVVIVLTQALISAGRPAAPLVGEVAALGATTLFTLCLFGHLGIYAAALGAVVGTVLSGLWLVLLYRRYSGLTPLRLFLPSRAVVWARGGVG